MAKALPMMGRFKQGDRGLAVVSSGNGGVSGGPSPAKKRPRENSQGEIPGGTDGEVLAADLKKEKIEDDNKI